jgi:putative toxin-antitoxin system antitoxin component (TIGR02293 family)
MTTVTKAASPRARSAPRLKARHRHGPAARDFLDMIRKVRAGFSYRTLADFQRRSGLTWEAVSQLVQIPTRTLARRQKEGRLHADESDRLLRVSTLFERTVDFFDGDVEAARRWLQAPQWAFGGEKPLDLVCTTLGVQEVDRLLSQLEHGVFS